jgi:uncharacterized protein (TIGR03086 family)
MAELIDLYDRASAWTGSKIAGAKDKLDAATRCDEWKVRDIVNHLLHGHQMFQGAVRGEQLAPPQGPPPELLTGDPAKQFEDGRQATIAAFRGASGDIERPVKIALADTLLHGSDIASATGQDATMPEDVAEVALEAVSPIPDTGAPGLFKPRVEVSSDASASDRLLGKTGRNP